jgi:DNA replicative helicase MCM subunit Mcm2 (Cdc46/Mcm family)
LNAFIFIHRYDELRSAADNIDLMSTILSRFDLIFIVRDIRDEERDRAIAKHVMSVHINAAQVWEIVGVMLWIVGTDSSHSLL